MNLLDICARLDEADDDGVIYARRVGGDFIPVSEATIVPRGEARDKGSSSDPCQDLSYCLEVYIAKEAVEVWSSWREGKKPDAAQATEAVCYKANNDAWGPPNFPVDGLGRGT